MLTVLGLKNGEYLISSVAAGVEEYYLGVGEAPGRWSGAWAAELGLEGEVDATELRSLINGIDPRSGRNVMAGQRQRSVLAFDLTVSTPKSVSLLWALGTPSTARSVAAAHRDAVAVALGFLEDRAAVARRQEHGVRRRVGTEGWAVAQFVHRTSREGDPQLHTHCLVPNIVRRAEDGKWVALDGSALFEWGRAAGCVYQNELQRLLAARLGVVWGPDRNNTREIDGFTKAQLRRFSKRTTQIERELELQGADGMADRRERMRADERASLATRVGKDRSLTPALLTAGWEAEAADADLAVGDDLERSVTQRPARAKALSEAELFAALVDDETGLCSRDARFTHADVVERLCALSGGTMPLVEIERAAERFLGSEHAVRLLPPSQGTRKPAMWSTAQHRALEDACVDFADTLARRCALGVPLGDVPEHLGDDQAAAVQVVCGDGGGLRSVLAPAGFGKTAMAHAAAAALAAGGRHVVAVATTAKAVGELEAAGIPAVTIARLRIDLARAPLPAGSVVLWDEVSQTSTRDANFVLEAAAGTPDGMVVALGDPAQSQPVGPGGIADHIHRLALAGRIPAASLDVNRRQLDPFDQEALALLRAGDAEGSQTLRTEHGWEHEHATPGAARHALAKAAAADIASHGTARVAVLTVSHGDAEDLADRVRSLLDLDGPALCGPGWTSDRSYQRGDRILLHTRLGRDPRLVNGTTGTVAAVQPDGLAVSVDGSDGSPVLVPKAFVQGCRPDGAPNLSHAWARTVDGAQGGTWEACHLLGTAALDGFRGYAGQSRSRLPTHTWNTVRLDIPEHGGRIADQRSPAEVVAAALGRRPDPTLAALDDPWPADRALRARLDEHRAALAGIPPDRDDEIERLERKLAGAELDVARAEREAARAAELRREAPRRPGKTARAERAAADRAIVHAAARHSEASEALGVVGREIAAARAAQTERTRMLDENRWRGPEIKRLAAELDDHWASVAEACARAGEPLAYGERVLVHAAHHRSAQRRDLEASLPPDRSFEIAEARRERTAERTRHQEAAERLRAAEADLAAARSLRRRKRNTFLPRAEQAVEHAAHSVAVSAGAAAVIDDQLAELRLDQQRRSVALDQVGAQLSDLKQSEQLLRDALGATQVDRVLAQLTQPGHINWQLLGEPPTTIVGQEAWLHHAYRLTLDADEGTRTRTPMELRLRDAVRDLTRRPDHFGQPDDEPARTEVSRDPADWALSAAHLRLAQRSVDIGPDIGFGPSL